MKIFTLESSQLIARPLEQVFAFFSDATNLEAITPPWLHFRVVTPEPIIMAERTRIDYGLRLRGIPMRWTSEIAAWEPPTMFIDSQIRGPYRRWIHTHTFTPRDGETLVEDHVEYAVPGGSPVDRFLVRPDLGRIFRYRREALARLLPAPHRHDPSELRNADGVGKGRL
jgi:ligand-binding SRPBCC domain-containing protein